jgi:ferritin
MIKKYIEFIKEADETEEISTESTPAQGEAQPTETDESDSSKFTEIKDEIKSMIEKTIEKSGGELNQFVDSFNKNPEDVKIEGFINDSDIYEFFLKWRNDIDEVLNDIKFFDENPVEINAIGLYDYVIKGTERAFQEVVKMIK